MRRITLDWDFKNKFKVLFYTLKILRLGFVTLEIKPSRKKGYHVYIWTKARGNIFTLREQLGDDKKHIAMDRLHKYARQTVFNAKRKVSVKKLKGGLITWK